MPCKRVIKTYDTISFTLIITLGKKKTLITLTALTTPPAAKSSYLFKPLKPFIIILKRVLPPLNDTQKEPALTKDT
jgi:hypothetical protein